MRTTVQWVRSLAFNFQMYLAMALMALAFAPLTFISRRWVFRAVHSYCNWVRWTAGWMVGLKSEIRGEVPDFEAIVASKHQSFFDIIIIVSAVPEPKFIMKKEILWTPFVGFYGKRLGCIPVDRGKRGQAIKKMVADVKSGASAFGQLIIFPQGTRVAAGAQKKYKIGAGVLYTETDRPCVPAATNVGVFWKRHGVMRHPGLAVVEFLPAIEPGLGLDAFMAEMEEAVETNSNRLMQEAGLELPENT
ncbi:lysophospholipid acyltransferase family protein [Aliiroseovarius sp.]|uniref:lysophospholipid acyltransferase family protein n=1 Tax=Aliiroseovarius sp. TaxID=1872442 RepID=UPI00260D3C43|nr:lysophospholipid acyltransferase family protein [Aliiroseovarius sp.]